MMQQADDFLGESNALRELIEGLSDAEFERPTAFKGWTLNNVIRHLHVWNYAADLSLTDGDAFAEFYAQVGASVAGGLRDFEQQWLDGLSGQSMLETWHDFYTEMAGRFGAADPSERVKWAGPDMSVRSSITARLMETWAHGQEIYDELGVVRVNKDRIRNIVVLGINTHGWTYAVRQRAAPDPIPHLLLSAPSGEIWSFNEPSEEERIEGPAEAFCQVVTQVRNVADTPLKVTGTNASDWMSRAQCIAGPAEDPPAPGVRHTRPSTSPE